MRRTQSMCAALVFAALGTGTAAADRQPTEDQDQPRPPSEQQQQPYGEPKPAEPKPPAEAPPSGQAKPPAAEKQVQAQKMTLTATIDEIDVKARKVTLRNRQGNTVQVEVPESAGSLEGLKKGDRVTIDYYQSIALQLKKGEAGGEAGKQPGKEPGMEPGMEHPGMTEMEMHKRSAAQLPGGMMARHIEATVEVMKVDKQNRQVTVKGPEGKIDTISVDPSMEADLAKLKKGDKITASYNEAIAVKVTPQKGAKGA